jgi:hypothetical protein
MTYKEIKNLLIKLGYKEQIVYLENKQIFNYFNPKTKQGLNLEIEEY